MEYFWKENKRFVIAVGGGFFVLLFYFIFVLWPIRAGAAEAANRRIRERRELERRMAQGVPTPDGLAAGRRDRDQTQKELAKMSPEVTFTLSDRFVKPKKEDIKSYYDNLKLNLTKELQQKATSGKVAFPQTLGLPDDVGDDNAVEVLSRLAIVDRLVNLAVDSEAEKIDVIDAQYGTQGDTRGGPAVKKSTFLTKYSVFMKMTGKVESVFRVIHGIQKKGNYLALTHFELGRTDATKDLFEASIAVALLSVDDKAGFEAN